MTNYTGTIYTSLEALETAVEAITNTVTIHIVGPDVAGRYLLVQAS